MDIFEVTFTKRLEKELIKVPKPIIIKLLQWASNVRKNGLREVGKIKSFHDEPIEGKERRGQRSIRLSKAYRAFYRIDESKVIHFIEVIEVNKHAY
jgi:proteic killer suppression protein